MIFSSYPPKKIQPKSTDTPQKFNMDTFNMMLWKRWVHSFKIWPFWGIQPFDFWGGTPNEKSLKLKANLGSCGILEFVAMATKEDLDVWGPRVWGDG